MSDIQNRIDGRPIIASVSGGKDSTAMCLYFKEKGLSYHPVFIDTGWENKQTYRFLREYLPEKIGEIEWIRASVELPPEKEEIALAFEARLGHYSAMLRTILKKGYFPRRFGRWCTQELKTYIIRDYLKGIDCEPINAVGIRSAESRARSKLSEWEYCDTYECDIWRPLIDWSEEDVIEIHSRHSILPNPNYLNGSTRVGCWPCVFARKEEIRNLAEVDPERIALLKDLEEVVTEIARVRYRKRNDKELESPSSWFSCRRLNRAMPIQEAVEWSKTKRGGLQYELFAAPQREQGCMRWGLCDVGKE